MKSNCPLCGNFISNKYIHDPQDHEYYVKRIVKTSYLECLNCKTLYQNPMPSLKEIDSFYGKDYQDYISTNFFLKKILHFSNNLSAKKFLKKYGLKSKILDYGCGDGIFIESLIKLGSKFAYGYEPNLRKNRIINKQYFLNKCTIEKKAPFDVIRMNHVIEHLVNLHEVLNWLKSLLSDNGLIVIQTPNAKTLTLNIFRSYWGPLHFPYHTFIGTYNGFYKLANKLNMSFFYSKGDIMPTGWSMSFENIFKRIFNIHKRGRLSIYFIFLIIGVLLAFSEKIFTKNTSVINLIFKNG